MDALVTTTVGMVNRVHSHTTSTRPAVALRLELEEGGTGLEEGLVGTTTTGDDADGGTGVTGHGLLGTGRETDTGLVLLGRVTDDGGVVARGTGKRSTVTRLLLNVANNRTLGALADREDVANVQGGLLAAVDERTGRHALGGDEGLGLELVAVRVTEHDGRERCTTASVVDNVLDETTDVTVTLGKVQRPQARRLLSVVGVGLEDPTGFTLVADDTTHG